MDIDLQILDEGLADSDRNKFYAAAQKLVWHGGIEGVRILVKGLDHPQKWEAAVWGITFELLSGDRKRLNDSLVRETLRPAVPILTGWIKEAKIMRGVSPLGLRVNRAVEALGRIGETAALPVLEDLLSRLQSELGGEEVREYAVDYTAAGPISGYKSSNSSVKLVETAITLLKCDA